MGIRTGQQYLEGLRDGREIWFAGERVTDVVSHPLLGRVALSIAELYDLQWQPQFQERLTFVLPESGERIGLSYIEPTCRADLERRRLMIKTWMDWNGGMTGRSPDFMNVHMTAFASAHQYFARGGEQFGRNIRRYYEWLRSQDLCLTHTLVDPQNDRSRAGFEQETALRIVRETDSGAVFSGARVLATLAPFSDEIAVFPSTYRPISEEAKPYAFAFCIPVATPGLRFICRPTYARPDGSVLDYPLSARLDEMDCVAVFDEVLVPWERIFVYREPELANGLFSETGCINHIMHQFATKDLAKAEFLLGIALSVADAIAIDGFQHVQNYLHEMINVVEMVRACITAAEVNALPGPNGTVLPNPEPLWTVRTWFPELYPRLVEIIRILGASGLIATPFHADMQGERAEDIARYYQAARLPAEERIDLFRLAWDASCSSFGGRQVLYERYFSGDPWRLAMARYQRYPLKEELKARVREFIERTHRWEAKLGG